MSAESNDKNIKDENPYLIMDFWQFAIMATLMVAFFPWSLLFCLIFFGLEDTKYMVLALLHDFLKTVWAILSVVVSLVLLFGLIYVIFQ